MPQQPRGQRAHVVGGERTDLDLLNTRRLAARGARAEGLEERAVRRLFGAVGPKEQDRRGAGGPQDLREHGAAVGVAPLQVVDGHDEASPPRQRHQQAPERTHGAPAQLAGVGHALHRRQVLDRRHVAQHWKEARESPYFGRERRSRLALRHRRQHVRQLVDDTVERLVGDRLALVAAPREHPDLGQPGQLLEEVFDQRGLAHARAAVDEDGDPTALARCLERGAEGLKVGRSPDEETLRRMADVGSRHAVRGRVEACEDLDDAGALVRGSTQECIAELDQVAGQTGHKGVGRWRVEASFLDEHLHGRSRERQTPRQRLEQHDPQAVPVARGRVRARVALLGRQVLQGARNAQVVGTLPGCACVQAPHEPEVEDRDTTVRSHHDVRGLEVAVDHPRGVQRGDPHDQLA